MRVDAIRKQLREQEEKYTEIARELAETEENLAEAERELQKAKWGEEAYARRIEQLAKARSVRKKSG
jgi:hypothetical protein